MHPIAAELAAQGLNQRKLVDLVAELGHRLSPSHLSQVLSGKRRAGRTLARAISKALKNRISPEAIVFWEPAASTGRETNSGSYQLQD